MTRKVEERGDELNVDHITVGAINRALAGTRFDNAAIDLAWQSMSEPLPPLKRRFALAVDGMLATRERRERQVHREDANCARIDLSGRDAEESPSLAREVLADRLEEMSLWPACFLRPKPIGQTFELWTALRIATLERVIKSHPAAFNMYVSDAVRIRAAARQLHRDRQR